MKKLYIAAALFALVAAGSAAAVRAQNGAVFSQENGVVKAIDTAANKLTVEVFNECKATSDMACAAWYSKEVSVDFGSVLVTGPEDHVVSDIQKLKVGMRARLFYKSGAVYAMKVMPPAGMPGKPGDGPIMCTMEAKLCPDGSSVGRTGPKCEFAACPGTGSSTSTASSTVVGKRICITRMDDDDKGQEVVCKTIPPGLRFGMKSEQIKHLQERLQKEGFLPADAATGYFGQMTLQAVKELQKIKGLPTTGFVGNMTLEKLEDKDD